MYGRFSSGREVTRRNEGCARTNLVGNEDLVFVKMNFSRPCTESDMAISYLLSVSRQGRVRLAMWFLPMSHKAKAKIVKDVTALVLARKARMCNILEYKETRVIYRRYASLYFIAGIASGDNELLTLEIIHRYVETLDQYFKNVCELDLIFNYSKAYAVSLPASGNMQQPV